MRKNCYFIDDPRYKPFSENTIRRLVAFLGNAHKGVQQSQWDDSEG